MKYWHGTFDWKQQEKLLNSFPQYTLPVNSIDLHFIHIPSQNPTAIPLLLLHGWPGSYFEFYKIIPLLQKEGKFHLVAPSLPGKSINDQLQCAAKPSNHFLFVEFSHRGLS